MITPSGFREGSFSGWIAPFFFIAGVHIGAPPAGKVAAGGAASEVGMSRNAIALLAPEEGLAVKAGTAEVVESLITA